MKFLLQLKNKVGTIVIEKTLEKFPFSIGRGGENDLVVADASISARHAICEEVEGVLVYRDLGSTNGSSHQSTKILEHQVRGLDSIFIGPFELVFVPFSADAEKTQVFASAPPAVELAASLAPVSMPAPGAARVQMHLRQWVFASASLLVLVASLYALKGRVFGERLSMSDPASIQTLKAGIYEVVVDKIEDDFVVYEDKEAFDKIPFQQKNDKYSGIGTAFSIEKNKYVTAAHVLDVRSGFLPRKFYLRDHENKVYEVAQVLRYSTRLDFAEFTLSARPNTSLVLKTAADVKAGEMVYTVGNAQGEGISVRSGNVASFTPEPEEGTWKYLRFSAAASPGNSGGPLLNAAGEVTGIVTMKNKSENLNFAFPIDRIGLADSKRAHLYSHRAETESNLRLDEKDEYFIDLPLKWQDFVKANQQKDIETVLARRTRFEKKYADQLFPRNPKLGRYLRDQEYVGLIGEVDADSSGTWKGFVPKMREIPISPKRSLYFGEFNGGQMQFQLTKNPGQTLASFLAKPREFFDTVVKAVKWGRKVSEATVSIRSYGDPVVQDKWKDVYGRVWLTYVWRTYFDDHAHMLNCLPNPSGITCLWDYSTASAESLRREYWKIDSPRYTYSYEGEYKEWREYLADKSLDDIKPDFLKELTIAPVANQRVEVAVSRQLKVNLSAKKVSPTSFLAIGFGIDPLGDYKIMRPMSVIFRPEAAAPERYISYMMYSPLKDSSAEDLAAWATLSSKNSPYNGMVTVESSKMRSVIVKDFAAPVRAVAAVSASAEVPRSAEAPTAEMKIYVKCENMLSEKKNAFRDSCKDFSSKLWFK